MMNQFEAIITGSSEEWLDTFPLYQKNTLAKLYEQSNNYEEVAQIWLTASLPNNAPFGSEKKSSIFYEKVLDEIEAFFSDDPKYEENRLAILRESGATQTYIVGVISAALAQSFDTTAVFLTPVIVIVLLTIAKMGINAWIAMRKEQRSQ